MIVDMDILEKKKGLSALCNHWGDDLKNVVLKSKKVDHMNSTNPRNYELFLEGAENLDQLCTSIQEAD